ncbi:hypothetical protein SNEBB_007339 [Seison nebaliae]|nr:hypothetical protein SNEBB_007339 [Seison nebaliae]
MKAIYYSDKYYDDVYEYRHVILPKDKVPDIPKGRLTTEEEWRALGVQQSKGWIHYMRHQPEPHILLFRRLKELSYDPEIRKEYFRKKKKQRELTEKQNL